MRWTSFTLGATLALSGTVYGSYGSNMMLDGAVGGMFQRRDAGQPDAASVLEGRQAAAGRCGADGGNAKCPAGQCCSQWGYCGVGGEFCNPIALCQSAFGSCLGASQSATAAPPPVTTTKPASPPPVTTTSAAPPPPKTTTTPASPPPSTSAKPPPPASTSPVPPGTLVPSTNGMCGNSTTCAGSGHGSCCSQFFYCGDGIDFCGTGCQSKFGLCFGGVAPPVSSASSVAGGRPTTSASATPKPSATSATSSAAAAPPASSTSAAALPPGVSVTTDGSCGNGKTCKGSTFGECCSQFGFCGTGDQFCPAIVACQPEWGRCDPATA
ncbi:uncharacterized protein SPSK_03515 [Sporothrix schenckii 1099-18]|uniref:Chitin-binding type-1 domain-containing protein n=2 Tax=Sporothrix schenckii TaxID=29908 RepID=U7PQE6_SPOS1|nr:uncharacterized protein SPSK_03515 [Sporothrix schenckii 1099-18]ERS97863.1 hypothetical protein HMPREF1624_06034 [Sporothrix schenckii ATCC 58251]KJR82431.1 hypothetical protein SPSK_03515 [Sporothrix schenckii 1099-18]